MPQPDAVQNLLGADLAMRLERWAAAARVDEAAGRRSRERWLRHQAEEEGSFAGVLRDLAERGVPIAVRVRGGRVHHGRIQVVGRDFVAITADGPGDALLALGLVSSVTIRPGEPVTVGDHQAPSRLSLVHVLTGLCAERERVMLVVDDGASTVVGTLQALGRDVVTIQLDGDRHRGTAYVPLGSLGAVILS